MCSLQYPPALLGGGRCAVATGGDFYKVRLVLLCGGRRTGTSYFRSTRTLQPVLRIRTPRVPRVNRVNICAVADSSPAGGDVGDGAPGGDDAVVVAESARRFSNLNEYGKATKEGADRSAPSGSVSGQVEVVNGASQADEARMPAPWNVGALLAMVWDRLMRNSLVAFITSWPAWQKRRKLERLLAEADANPQDAEKQAALLAELFKQRLAVLCQGLFGASLRDTCTLVWFSYLKQQTVRKNLILGKPSKYVIPFIDPCMTYDVILTTLEK